MKRGKGEEGGREGRRRESKVNLKSPSLAVFVQPTPSTRSHSSFLRMSALESEYNKQRRIPDIELI